MLVIGAGEEPLYFYYSALISSLAALFWWPDEGRVIGAILNCFSTVTSVTPAEECFWFCPSEAQDPHKNVAPANFPASNCWREWISFVLEVLLWSLSFPLTKVLSEIIRCNWFFESSAGPTHCFCWKDSVLFFFSGRRTRCDCHTLKNWLTLSRIFLLAF